MTIIVVNLQKRIPLKIQPILQAAKTVLKHEGIKTAELTIVFLTDSRIRSLHKKYLNEDQATDVLSFDFLTSKKNMRQILGEIIISTDTAVKNAKIYHTTPHREMMLYVIHGILHLLGYDDHSPADIQKMRRKEQALLRLVK